MFDSDSMWRQITIHNDTRYLALTYRDTFIIAVTNRAMNSSGPRLFSQERDSAGRLHFMLVKMHNAAWDVYLLPSLRDILKAVQIPENAWVIYTEGFGKIFTAGMDRGLRLNAQHSVNVIYLDYPSYSTAKGIVGNYHFALRNAKIAGYDFAPVLDTIARFRNTGLFGNTYISLLFHSMGNNVMREILLHDSLLAGMNDRPWAENLIFNSACVPEKDHATWMNKAHFAQHIYVHFNRKDKSLAGAKFMSFTNQLGQKPRRPLAGFYYSGDHRQLVTSFNNGGAPGVIYINFHPLVGNRHSNFTMLLGHPPTIPAAMAHYRLLFRGDTVHVSDRSKYAPGSFHHIGYDILPLPAER